MRLIGSRGCPLQRSSMKFATTLLLLLLGKQRLVQTFLEPLLLSLPPSILAALFILLLQHPLPLLLFHSRALTFQPPFHLRKALLLAPLELLVLLAAVVSWRGASASTGSTRTRTVVPLRRRVR